MQLLSYKHALHWELFFTSMSNKNGTPLNLILNLIRVRLRDACAKKLQTVRPTRRGRGIMYSPIRDANTLSALIDRRSCRHDVGLRKSSLRNFETGWQLERLSLKDFSPRG